ncbi:MAG: T9SS type A sorting domain-containing protein, partial [Bacteroidales bacterium]|nr:T9SS type A sorting domain-containing protein [Bacteroidales bacterium]
APLAMDPVDSGILYFGSYRVWKSTNGGSSWNDVSGDITKGINQYFHTITTIAVSPLNNNIVIAGTGDGLIHISTNAGATWENITNGIPDRWITRVIADPYDENTIYATISGFRWDEQLPHVYKSEDLGQTWQSISGNLPELPVNDIVLDPMYPGYIYIGTDAGVFFTNNNGQEWFMLSDGLPSAAVVAMKIHNTSRSLVIGTYGVSMYRLNLDDLVSVDELINRQYAKIKVFPNPFSNYISIQGELPEDMKIQVYNAAGTLILNTDKINGSELSGLERGVYFFSFVDSNGKTFQTEKVIKQ